MPLIAPAGSALQPSSFQITRSLRFNNPHDGAYLSRTPTATGERRAFTYSAWVKRSQLSNPANFIFTAFQDTNNWTGIFYYSTVPDTFSVSHIVGGVAMIQRRTIAVCRDPTAWHHICVSMSTISATPTCTIEVNGVTLPPTVVNITAAVQNDLLFTNAAGIINYIGYYPSHLHCGLLADVHFLDGQIRTASAFAETDPVTGEWVPKKYTGVYGTNGFRLTFANNASTATIGMDDGTGASGSGAGVNDFTANNISVTAGRENDSLVDVPNTYGIDTGLGGEVRGNYCTLNTLDAASPTVISIRQTGLEAWSVASAIWATARGSSWAKGGSAGKWYWECTPSIGADGVVMIGILGPSQQIVSLTTSWHLGQATDGYGWSNVGVKWNNNVGTAYGAGWTNGDTIGIAYDADAGTLTFYKNGASQGIAFSGIQAWGAAFAPAVSVYQATTTGAVAIMNFGQRPFENTAPVGFKSPCTTNIPAPTIKRGDDAFSAHSRLGTAANYSVIGKRFQPDVIWSKDRSTSANVPVINDVVRGPGQGLSPNNDLAVIAGDFVQSFTAAGYNGGVLPATNTSGNVLIDWMWKRGIPQGCDVVTYTGTGVARTVAHGLGNYPAFMLVKAVNAVSSWAMYHWYWSSGQYFLMDIAGAVIPDGTVWNTTNPTPTVFTVGTNPKVNATGLPYVAYLFGEVPGYCRVWYYVGNGLADGPFVWCGFRPKWVMIKNSATIDSSRIYDATRNPNNPVTLGLLGDTAALETTFGEIDFLSNGFKIRNTEAAVNGTGQAMAFYAFAESPSKYSRARI